MTDTTERVTRPAFTRALAGGRLSMAGDQLPFSSPMTILPPSDAEDYWRTFQLDATTLARVSPSRLMELLADLSPEVSRALWDFLRLANPGWECVAFRPGTETQDARAQAAIDSFLSLLGSLYGSVDVVLGRLFIGGFLRGAFLAELVLDKPGRMPVDLAIPDPVWMRFRRVDDPIRGIVWELGQQRLGQWVSLEKPTIRYVPIDPFPDSPYGRPLATPALFTSLFLLGLLHDLRRVVAQQGYPRFDVEISMENLQAAMPEAFRTDGAAQKDWIDAAIREVQTIYDGLEPDDAFVHTDVVKVNRPVGTIDSSSLGAVDGLIQGLERMATRALKTMPLMMGNTEGTSEAQANRQWEIFAAGMKALQHSAEQLLERLLTVALQAQGIQATVQFRFAEMRAAEMMRDAQTLALTIANHRELFAAGWVSQDEASLAVTGHVADQPEPREAPQPVPAALADEQPEPGSNRIVRVSYVDGVLTPTYARASEEPPPVPSGVEITPNDVDRAVATWRVRWRDTEFADLLDAEVVAPTARANGHSKASVS